MLVDFLIHLDASRSCASDPAANLILLVCDSVDLSVWHLRETLGAASDSSGLYYLIYDSSGLSHSQRDGRKAHLFGLQSANSFPLQLCIPEQHIFSTSLRLHLVAHFAFISSLPSPSSRRWPCPPQRRCGQRRRPTQLLPHAARYERISAHSRRRQRTKYRVPCSEIGSMSQ